MASCISAQGRTRPPQATEFLCPSYLSALFQGVRALASVLTSNIYIKRLDLRDNGLCGAGAEALADVLRKNSIISGRQCWAAESEKQASLGPLSHFPGKWLPPQAFFLEMLLGDEEGSVG